MNWFWVRKVHQRITEPHVKFNERQEFITFRYTVSFVRIWSWNAWKSVVRKNSLLQTVRCKELAHEICYVVPSVRCRLLIFHWWACVKLVDDILDTWSDRLLLCFAYISNWVVTNFSVGFCCVMFMSTVAVLGVYSAWHTIKYYALI